MDKVDLSDAVGAVRGTALSMSTEILLVAILLELRKNASNRIEALTRHRDSGRGVDDLA